jgi:hypothetical protein
MQSLDKTAAPLCNFLQQIRIAGAGIAAYGLQLPTPLPSPSLTAYLVSLQLAKDRITDVGNIPDALSAATNYQKVPKGALDEIAAISKAIAALPDASKEDDAKLFLTIGQERLQGYREARRLQERAKEHASLAKTALDSYASASTARLTKLYEQVQKDFSEYYRFVNQEDESDFQGKLTPSAGKLAFDVDFYGRGYFPPGAYHSEGHQDGMGLCLYLALMKSIQHLRPYRQYPARNRRRLYGRRLDFAGIRSRL